MRQSLIAYAAGSVGALANSLAVWAFGAAGINAMLGVAIAPHLSPHWLYPRLVWGGLWGLTFLWPGWRSRWLAKGSLISLLPTAAQLFIVFPILAHKGVAGLELGLLTPLCVLFFNWVWGVTTAAVIRYA